MACRHLTIEFRDTGDVEYHFFRHHSQTMLHRYVIEWPADRVDLTGGQCLRDHNFRQSVTADGYLLLEWDKVPEADTGLGRGVDYIKRGYLTRPVESPMLWRYQEKLAIKPSFSLWLHSPFQRLSAIQRQSRAVFRTAQGSTASFRPRDLSEHVFHDAGELDVDWHLELLDTPRTH